MSSKGVFVLGCDRSGTTLLRAVLNRHPEIWITYEAPVAIVLKEVFEREGQGGFFEALRLFPQFEGVQLGAIENERGGMANASFPEVIRMIYETRLSSLGKSVWGDKTPAYTRFVTALDKMFPECLFVHMVRDPRAVSKSWVNADWGPNTHFHAGREWKQRVTEAREQLALIDPSRVTTVRYEDLLGDPKGTLMSICRFLSLEFTESMLDCCDEEALPTEYLRSLHDRSTKEFDAGRMERWRGLPQRSIELVELSSWELMQEYGYRPESIDKPKISAVEMIISRIRNRVQAFIHDRRRVALAPQYPLPDQSR